MTNEQAALIAAATLWAGPEWNQDDVEDTAERMLDWLIVHKSKPIKVEADQGRRRHRARRCEAEVSECDVRPTNNPELRCTRGDEPHDVHHGVDENGAPKVWRTLDVNTDIDAVPRWCGYRGRLSGVVPHETHSNGFDDCPGYTHRKEPRDG